MAMAMLTQMLLTYSRRLLRNGLGLAMTTAIVALAIIPLAAHSCVSDERGEAGRPVVSLRLDNDVLGGRRQDQNYTGGTIVTVRSPNLTDFVDDPCLPRAFQSINRYLRWLQPAQVTDRNMVFSLAHLAFTPGDRLRTDVISEDRPYAAALLFSIGYNGRNQDDLQTTHLRLGIVGPAAQGERVQNVYHDTLGLKRFNGWNNQLRNEVVGQLAHERMHRWATESASRGWGSDLISHWGGSLGNYATHLNGGAELRFGWRLPDDFGSSSLRPAGENLAPNGAATEQTRWAGHLFMTIDARAVLRDITLDGNTFQTSHRVSKRHWVADMGFGFVVRSSHWKLTLGRYYRTREFDGQQELPAFGSISLSRRF